MQYGGCAGNGNNFLTEDECRDKCVNGAAAEERRHAQFESREEICRMEAESGRCRGAFPKWYHDAEVGECREFTWGGCGGNENQGRGGARQSNAFLFPHDLAKSEESTVETVYNVAICPRGK